MDRIISIIAGTAVLSGALVLLGWFSLPVRVVVLVGVAVAVLFACRRGDPPWSPVRTGGDSAPPLHRFRTFVLRHSSFVIPVLLTLSTLLILASSATTDPIRSPWSVVPSAFFALYALLVGVAVLLAFRGSRAATLGIACAIAIGSAVALLVYPIGFGFDHFIHAAAERIIVDTGALTPRPFFYSAHYGLVALIATLGIPVAIADRLLAPLLTVALLVPLAVRTLSSRGALALLLIPFLPLAVSTPQATANVFALCAALQLISSSFVSRAQFRITNDECRMSNQRRMTKGQIAEHPVPELRHSSFVLRHSFGHSTFVIRHSLLPLAAFLSNPLTGIPLLGAVAATLFARAHHRTLAVFSVIGGVIGIPIALAIATRTNTALDLRIGFSFTPLHTALASIRDAFTFHAADFSTSDALSIARVVFPVLWIVLAIAGATLMRRATRSELRHSSFVILPSIPLLSALLVSLTTTLSSQLAEEQSQLPLRLLSLAAILSVPLVGRAVSQISPPKADAPQAQNLSAKGGKFQITSAAAALVLATLATFTLLLSYPRDDAQARSGLWSVSADDIAAVHAIASDAGTTRYVVLANQMLGAAAIREFEFQPSYRVCDGNAPDLSPSVVGGGDKEGVERTHTKTSTDSRCTERLAFPLPAGGPLAQHFWSYLEQQNQCTQFGTAVQNCVTAREPIDAAMRIVAANRAYIVLHAYWRNYDRLATATAAIADAEVGNFQNIRIFRFTAPTP